MGCDGLLYIMFYLDQGDFTASKYWMQHLSFGTNLTDSEGRWICVTIVLWSSSSTFVPSTSKIMSPGKTQGIFKIKPILSFNNHIIEKLSLSFWYKSLPFSSKPQSWLNPAKIKTAYRAWRQHNQPGQFSGFHIHEKNCSSFNVNKKSNNNFFQTTFFRVMPQYSLLTGQIFERYRTSPVTLQCRFK